MTSRLSRSPKSIRFWGSLCLCLACLAPRATQAQDVEGYQVIRGEYFTQATTNRAATGTAQAHALSAYLIPLYNGAVESATVHSPSGWMLAMTNTGSVLELPHQAGDTIDLSAPAAAGTYLFDEVGTTKGELQTKLALPGVASGLPPVRIANLRDAEAVDASQPFLLQWEKVPRRNARDYLALDIYDSDHNQIFHTESLSLDQTNLTLPSGTLQPNTTNFAYLDLHHYFGTSMSGMIPYWLTAEDRVTRFLIRTINPAGVLRFSPLCVTALESM